MTKSVVENQQKIEVKMLEKDRKEAANERIQKMILSTKGNIRF